jgi:hypothetical protein
MTNLPGYRQRQFMDLAITIIHCTQGTNNGAFMRNQQCHEPFPEVEGTSGQIGSFLVNEDDLLVAPLKNGLMKIVAQKPIR